MNALGLSQASWWCKLRWVCTEPQWKASSQLLPSLITCSTWEISRVSFAACCSCLRHTSGNRKSLSGFGCMRCIGEWWTPHTLFQRNSNNESRVHVFGSAARRSVMPGLCALSQSWELEFSCGRIVKIWPFSEAVWPQLSCFTFFEYFKNLAEFWPNLHVKPHSGI